MSKPGRGPSLQIFLDTSILSDASLSELATTLAEVVLSGDEFFVSVLTHFQVLWGYGKAGLAATRYRDFLAKLSVNVAPLVEEDAAVGAQRKPTRENVVDALISATVSRYGATIWTKDKDFLRYMPKEKVKVV